MSNRLFPWGSFVLLLACLISAPAGYASPGAAVAIHDTSRIVWIETERFADLGGWTLDSQFIDQMGSPYLLAGGLGTPVRDAVTTVRIAGPGRYRVWARTRDWSPPHHPGRFQIWVNGKPLAHDLGASGKEGWGWEDGGEVELGGSNEIRLHDMTGYYGRCDTVVLAAEPQWAPPTEKEALAMLREQLGGVSRQIKDQGEWDVVVVGGGLAGCMAAVSAARMGAKAVLIQNRPMLGGNGSTEILVPPVGVTNAGTYKKHPLDPRETGLIEEVRTAGAQKTIEATYYPERLLRLVKLEPNLELFLNTHATGAELRAGSKEQIAAVLAVDALSGERKRFKGNIFIDCTGDGSVGVAAGAEWRQGREARAEFGESMAPEAADKTTMGNSLKYAALPSSNSQPFTAPDWAMRMTDCTSFTAGRHPRHPSEEMGWQWMLELGGMGDTYAQKEETRDELFKLIYGIWDHVKNHCPQLKGQVDNYKLAWVETVVGVRESRRLIGDYIFHEADVTQKIVHPDRIAYGAWGLDDHPSEGFFRIERNTNHKYGGVEHSIPYRILYSKNIANLMMAGRNVSASHIGMGTTRVMITCAVMGMAAGTAAGMCVCQNETPRGIYQRHIGELQQQLLKDGAFIIDLKNEDPRDLARKATLRASSEGTTRTVSGKSGEVNGKNGEVEVMAAEKVIDGVARARLDSAHAWEADKKARGPHWIELAWAKPQTFNMVHVTFLRKDIAARRFEVQAWNGREWLKVAEVQNPGVFRRCLIPVEKTTTEKLRVVLEKPAGICEIRVYEEPERALESARRAMENMRKPDTGAGFPWERGKD